MFALFYEKSSFGCTDIILRIGDPKEIREQLGDINDWSCLISMGRSMGPKSDQADLSKLEHFLSTCEDRKSLENLKIKISTGELGCVMCAETEDELEKMRSFVLSSSKVGSEHGQEINGLFDRLVIFLKTNERTPFISQVSRRQYIGTGIACDNYLGQD